MFLFRIATGEALAVTVCCHHEGNKLPFGLVDVFIPSSRAKRGDPQSKQAFVINMLDFFH